MASTRKSLPTIATSAEQPLPLGLCSVNPKSPTRANSWSANESTGSPVASAWAITRPDAGSERTSVIMALRPSPKTACSCPFAGSGVAATSHPSGETAKAGAASAVLPPVVTILATDGQARSTVAATLGNHGVRTIWTMERPGTLVVAAGPVTGAKPRPIKPPAAAAPKPMMTTSGQSFGRRSSPTGAGRGGSRSLTEHLPLRLLDLLGVAAVDEPFGQGSEERAVVADDREIGRFARVESPHHRADVVGRRQRRVVGAGNGAHLRR